MALGLYSLIEAVILCLNAVCVLHEERFLAKIGWGSDQRGFGEAPGMKTQALNLIRSIRTVMRIPLIGINIVVIALKLVFG
ncbi:immediate early response 3-interacting protein 1-like [Crassostrea virginica]|uniref:Immediate early response 3-interacting protein 1 n=1 Tax=Crassostrea virginica TaxID=6565 RepID=A0A8B8E317_CRAVI|nr:immediate early response 3-interacting protein 1-like [Crassostrea virginica]XP_022334610.1 immediate early response 3-interacting protein 1-like [Crassostrea virginica]